MVDDVVTNVHRICSTDFRCMLDIRQLTLNLVVGAGYDLLAIGASDLADFTSDVSDFVKTEIATTPGRYSLVPVPKLRAIHLSAKKQPALVSGLDNAHPECVV